MPAVNSPFFKISWSYMGMEPGRLQFSWVSSAESTKFVEVVKAVTAAIKTLGPNTNFAKTNAKVA
jgi:coenzyme F420-reducing hydrogenase delta subunit